ncbi:imidazoleglycerol-phosphate dehydratase HisB [Ruminococcaceae bacterium OttesenSCG-928-A16]|nr:imidazoleglycerol-phosphate dehydratase HisB [Ruminococcaceae bacterium OttesenSCG-928-A16]
MRTSRLQRSTSETEISCAVELDGTGQYEIDTGCGFLNHMLELFARHGRFNLNVLCRGDVQVDYHHTVEDIGILLGRAFSQALGNRAGIVRYGSMLLPMDEALVLCAVDISGRGLLVYKLDLPAKQIGDFDLELVKEFFMAFARELGATIHLRQLDGENSHHIAEAAFKGFARALAAAVAINPQAAEEIPSTKGTIL